MYAVQLRGHNSIVVLKVSLPTATRIDSSGRDLLLSLHRPGRSGQASRRGRRRGGFGGSGHQAESAPGRFARTQHDLSFSDTRFFNPKSSTLRPLD